MALPSIANGRMVQFLCGILMTLLLGGATLWATVIQSRIDDLRGDMATMAQSSRTAAKEIQQNSLALAARQVVDAERSARLARIEAQLTELNRKLDAFTARFLRTGSSEE